MPEQRKPHVTSSITGIEPSSDLYPGSPFQLDCHQAWRAGRSIGIDSYVRRNTERAHVFSTAPHFRGASRDFLQTGLGCLEPSSGGKRMTTTARALAAAKQAEKAGFVVREVVVEGRGFRLVFGDRQEMTDEYAMRPIRAT